MAKKILVVDDELNIVKVICSRLKAAGYDVIAAGDGLQAIEKAQKEKPDLIILDVRMPAGNGLSVYEKLSNSSNTSIIPVIFITAFPSDDIRKKALEMGASDFIPKPFDGNELLSKVKKALGETDGK